MTIRTLIVDDHKLFRQGLRSLLDEQPQVEVVGEADNGRTALNMVHNLHPDVVIMDVAMPELNGIEATSKIKADDASIKVLALSMYTDRRYVTQMLNAGASGYLLKDCAFEELAEALDAVRRDKVYLSPRVQKVVVQNLRNQESQLPRLTPREREVLQLIAEGHSTKEIAGGLTISVKTVESHRKQIMDKLELRTVAQLTKYAVREGLTTLDG